MINSDTLKSFLSDDLDVDTTTLNDTSALFSSGLVDSFSLVALMAFIEDTGQIRISPSEVTTDNLDSIERILNFVADKS